MKRINEIIDTVLGYHPGADVKAIMKAYVYSAKVHAGQRRSSGEPYLSHPLAVAALLSEMQLDVASICAGLLHDTVEDTEATLADITALLGAEVASLVDGVTKITLLAAPAQAKPDASAMQAQNLRKMILAMANDIRVLLIKLADRLHNMRTLGYLKPEKQRRIAQETRDIYAPMAHRLGVRRWQIELEDLAFYYLDPEIYQRIKEEVAQSQAERNSFINEVIAILQKKMQEAGISCSVYGRPKHFASIYGKMQRRNVDISELYDLLAFRVLVGSIKDCYEALGVVHTIWKPVPGRFRDYIGMPKANMYQSLHTAVVGPMGQRMEVQIRTEDMHRIAEEGIAAHWRYKEQEAGDDGEQRRFAWLRRLLEWQQELDEPGEFMNSLRMDLYPEEIFVFTPTGEVKELPKGATPVDFAYAIHTQVGDRCVGAKIDGRMAPLRTELKTGDQVEIITNAKHTPSKDWLAFVKTNRARSKIRAYVRKQESERAVALGRDLLERELRKSGVTLNAAIKDQRAQKVAEELSFTELESMLAAVAYGKLSPRQVANRIAPRPEAEVKKPGFIERSIGRLRKKSPTGITVKGVEDVLVRFAGCCNPLHGDPVVGFITRGRGVTVHRADCPYLDQVEPERRVEVEWDAGDEHVRPVRITVESADRQGLFADVAQVLKQHNINILEGEVKSLPEQRGLVNLLIQVHDTKQLNRIFAEIKKIKGVNAVRRVGVGKTEKGRR